MYKSKKVTRNPKRLEDEFRYEGEQIVEALIGPTGRSLFQDRGYKIQWSCQRAQAQRKIGVNDWIEIPLILASETTVFPITVRESLEIIDIDDGLADLAEFTHFFPRYRSYHIYGAVAGLDVPESILQYACRKGLFVVSMTGDDLVEILNDEHFSPKDFGYEK